MLQNLAKRRKIRGIFLTVTLTKERGKNKEIFQKTEKKPEKVEKNQNVFLL